MWKPQRLCTSDFLVSKTIKSQKKTNLLLDILELVKPTKLSSSLLGLEASYGIFLSSKIFFSSVQQVLKEALAVKGSQPNAVWGHDKPLKRAEQKGKVYCAFKVQFQFDPNLIPQVVKNILCNIFLDKISAKHCSL